MIERIAVIGLSCLFPGAATPAEFWQNLQAEKDSTFLATAEQMGVDPAIFFEPTQGKAGKTYYLRGGYIQDFTFDATGYHMPPSFLEKLDNLFKWSLYVAKEALRDSGYLGSETVLKKCGVILGNLSFPTKSSQQVLAPIYHRPIETAIRALLENEDFSLANLDSEDRSLYNTMISGYPAAIISQALALSGVSFSLDSACASSLFSVKLACQYLLAHRADLMLAGGVNGADPLVTSLGFSSLQAFPPDGISRPFDQSSGGLTVGHGAGMLVLKRYGEAVRDGDHIYATISGIGLSNDGRGKHPLTPNPKGQRLAFERAYAAAGINPNTVDYVECHATGTPIGDITELDTMDSFFSQYQATPLVGAVKSNIGHLLTAAGMAGMIKVILSLSEGLVPPTINLNDPLSSRNGRLSAAQMVSSNRPWLKNASLKRAGVNAFGFGGTNAHIIFERQEAGDKAEVVEAEQHEKPAKMAIIGMEAFFGACQGLDAFERTIYDGSQHFGPIPTHRWQGIERQPQQLSDYGFENGQGPSGAYIEDFEIDALRIKLPPNEVDQLNPQQLLMLKVADEALRDAGLEEGSNVAVIVAMGTELSFHRLLTQQHLSWQIKKSLEAAHISLPPEKVTELEDLVKESLHHTIQPGEYLSMIGNILASRVSALWDFSGPAFTLSAEENSVFKALEVAQLLLATEEVDAVLVGAVDLAGGVENVLIRNQLAQVNTGVNTLSHDQQANGWLVGEGAGAVVLKRYEKATAEKQRIYAVIDAVSVVQGNLSAEPAGPAAGGVERACREVFDKAGVNAADIGYLEIFGSGLEPEDDAEQYGLRAGYRAGVEAQSAQSDLSCAIGSVKANIGHTYNASGIASLIKTALCLYHRYIPATPGWSTPKKPAAWAGGSFYVPTESKPWFVKQGMTKRVAAINGLGLDGAYTHLILSEDVSHTARPSKYLSQTPFYLFPIAADDRSAIIAQLDILAQAIQNGSALPDVARQSFVTFQNQRLATYAVAIVGHHKDEIIREIQHARTGVTRAFEQGIDWKTPLGSYFTAKPLGQQGDVSFIYPGAFTSYIGLMKDLFHLFPQTYDKAASLAVDMGLGIEQYLYPRSLSRLGPLELEKIEAQLMADTAAMLKAGSAAAWLFTVILKDLFDVQPKSAFGYSLGEFSMLLAMDVWHDIEQTHADPRAFPLFNYRLSGPKNAVRQFWGLPQTHDQADEALWGTYVLLVPSAAAEEALKHEERVYLTHINAPSEVVIAGDRQGCLRIIESLKCDYFRAPFDAVLHCEAIASEYDEFVNLFTLPVHGVPEPALFSAANYGPITLESETIAHNIAKALCKQLDFPQLINQIYQRGARIFVELGASSTCTRWINETLSGKPHLAIPINRRGVDDHASIIKLLAQLLSHRTTVDLSLLYETDQNNAAEKLALIKTITLGGRWISDTILTDENKRRFKKVASIARSDHGSKQPLPIPQREPVYAQPISTFNPQTEALVQAVRRADLHHFPDQDVSYQNATAGAHASFLQTRRDSLQQIGQLIQLQMTIARQSLGHNGGGPEPKALTPTQTQTPSIDYVKPAGIIFDEAEVLEFASGKIANVFGPEYSLIDTYPRRVRLPMPPYLFISRVTDLQAEPGRYEPCSIETEYDIPDDAWYAVDGKTPGAVAVEASHANMLLISYLGIDFENQGRRVYRALDCKMTFLADFPKAGDTIRCKVQINSFLRTGGTLLFFYSYDCFVKDKLILKMNGGAGFFTDEEMASSRGITVLQKQGIQKEGFEPLLSCAKTRFEEIDLLQLSEGHVADCFGAQYRQAGRNSSLRLPPPAMRMIDRVTSVDPKGGAWGLGLIVGEKILSPKHWYFNCHFKDDLCMPGVVIGEACSQLLQFYMLFLGLQTCTTDACFQPIPNLTLVGRNRGQIRPTSAVLIFQLEVIEIGLSPKPFVKANFNVIFKGMVISRGENLGIQLSEKTKVVE